MSSLQRRKRESKRAASVLPWHAQPHCQLHKSTHAPTMQPRDNKRARLLPSATLSTLDNDLLVRCASYLDADGLAQLGRTSVRFGIPHAGQQRSSVNEAAHQRFRQSATDEERGCLPKYGDESDIGLYRALEKMRQPLRFDELAGDGFSPQENPARVTHTADDSWSTAMSGHAMSGHTMRGGRHFVEFSITNNEGYTCLGVIRPVSLTNGIDVAADWGGQVIPVVVSSNYQPVVSEKLRSQRTAKWGDSNVHCCTYCCSNGQCYWTDWHYDKNASDWQGRDGLGGSGGTIGLLLDLDEGTLSLFKNGRLLGMMKDGLSGEYCWSVSSVYSTCTISMSRGIAPK